MQKGVVLYEDNQQLMYGISQLLTYASDYILLGAFPDVLEVEAQVKALKPDIVLMDIAMPGGMNGIEAVRKLRAFDEKVPVIMLTIFEDNENVLEAIYAGASGYLLKKHLSERLLAAMQEILSGGAPMSPGVARMVIASMQRRPLAVQETYNLTRREKEILTALAKGTGYKAISTKLKISVDTVRSHIKNIYQKMQVHSQLEAVSKGRDAGIL